MHHFPGGVTIVEVNYFLDASKERDAVCFVLSRNGGPLEYLGVFRDIPIRDGRIRCRIPYSLDILPEGALSIAFGLALDACAEMDNEPPTERRTPFTCSRNVLSA